MSENEMNHNSIEIYFNNNEKQTKNLPLIFLLSDQHDNQYLKNHRISDKNFIRMKRKKNENLRNKAVFSVNNVQAMTMY